MYLIFLFLKAYIKIQVKIAILGLKFKVFLANNFGQNSKFSLKELLFIIPIA